MIPTYDEIDAALATLNDRELDTLVGAILAEHVDRGLSSREALQRVTSSAEGGARGSDAFDAGEKP